MTIRRALTVYAAPVLALVLASCGELEGDPKATAQEAIAGNDHHAARALLIQALSKNPDDVELRLALTDSLLGLGDGVGAQAALERLPAGTLESGRPAALMANALLVQDKAEEALGWLDKTGSEDPLAAWARIGALLALERREEAFATADRAIADHPENARLLALRGEMAARERMLEQAKRLADRALAADGGELSALMLAGKIAVLREDFVAAEKHYQTAAARNPAVVSPLLSLAAVQADTGQRDAAGDTLKRARKMAPTHPIALLLDAKLAFAEGNLDRAHQLMQEGEMGLRKVPAAQLLLGEIAHLRGNHEQAIAFLRHFTRENPVHIQGAMVLAQAYIATNEPEKAWNAVERPAARAAASPQLLALASRLAQQTGREDRFAARIGEKQPPSDFDKRMFEADRAIAQRDWEAARTIYAGLIDDGMGGHAVVLNNAALASIETGHSAAALDYARRAMALTPEDPQVIDTMGWTLLGAGGNKAEALSHLQRAQKLMPGNLEIRWHLAAALAANGRKAEARRMAQGVRSFAGPEQREHIDRLLANL